MVVRWHLYDPSTAEDWTFEINPDEGGSPTYEKTITEQATTAPGGKTLLFEGADPPKRLEFSGTLLSQAHLDALVRFWSARRQVRLTDDLGRVFWIYIATLKVTRKRNAERAWKHTYQVSSIILSWP